MLRSRFTFANIISVLALFLALGGVSYAATQLPKNSVDTAQLRGEAVTADKLADKSVSRRTLSTSVRAQLDRAGTPGPQGPAGAQGPAGPQGPGAVGLRFSADGTPGATPQTIATIGGLTLKAACQTSGGETGLTFAVSSQSDGEIVENFQNDNGSDPNSVGLAQSGNLAFQVPAGETVLGSPPPVASGAYFRTIATLVYTSGAQTTSIVLTSIADGTTAHCSVAGTAVTAS